ncbi:MAG: Rieske (2Fe-2S) protein [Calditrichaceae bacterium]
MNNESNINRRSFFIKLGLLLSGLVSMLVAIPVLGAHASPLPWSGKVSETASWLRRVSDNSFIAFSINCAHLGCPVRWIEDAELFLCPCHGGVYNKDGSYAAGPPPHGLRKYPVRVRDGNVEIEASAIPITNL